MRSWDTLLRKLEYIKREHGTLALQKALDDPMIWDGDVSITVKDKWGNPIEVWRKHNMIMDLGKNMIRDVLSGATSDGKIKYIALGDNVAALASNQTTLGDELFRKATTTQSSTVTGQIVTTNFIDTTEATSFTIQEIGWFAGPLASSSANTGIMVARILYSRAKSSSESLVVDRTDSFS